MRKFIFEETGGTYSRAGGCLVPNLVTGTRYHATIGIWGRRHLEYIQEYRQILYNSLVLNGKLNSYLVEIDRQAQESLDTIIHQAVQSQGIMETLKAENPLAWIGKMNSIRCTAEEIVNTEIIYV